MKIICKTATYVDEKTTCRKEYCCNKLKIAMNNYTTKSDSYSLCSNFSIENNKKIMLTTHETYSDGNHYMQIFYCPFCGEKLIVEKIEIDETENLPIKIVEKKVYIKRKHWWNE